MSTRSALITVFAALALLAGGHALLGGGQPDAARDTRSKADSDSATTRATDAGANAADARAGHSPALRSHVQAAAGLPGSRRDERNSAARITNTAAPPVAADAAQSLAQALQHGDGRSPPIARDATPPQRPTAAELADTAAYRRYENRQQARLHRAFQTEATIMLGDMQRDIARARAQGLPPELIAEGEEKQRKLEQTLRALENGELQ